MTVIVWDGRHLAVDRQATYGETGYEIQKSEKWGDIVFAYCGSAGAGQSLIEWYKAGFKAEDFPSCAQGKEGATLIVAGPDGVVFYDGAPGRVKVLGKRAWGSGSDIALGAMMAGADARNAAEYACMRCVSCGYGIDVYEVEQLPEPCFKAEILL